MLRRNGSARPSARHDQSKPLRKAAWQDPTRTGMRSAAPKPQPPTHAPRVVPAQTQTTTRTTTRQSAPQSARKCLKSYPPCAAPALLNFARIAPNPIICASTVSLPTFVARYRSDPVPLMVAPVTELPACFTTGMDSPVIMDSSTADEPAITTPSTGSCSPGRIAYISDRHLLDRNFLFNFTSYHASVFRLQSRQRAHGLSSTDTSARFKQLADQHQRITTPTASKYGSRAFSGRICGINVTTHE